jgi:hypothetical protein
VCVKTSQLVTTNQSTLYLFVGFQLGTQVLGVFVDLVSGRRRGEGGGGLGERFK